MVSACIAKFVSAVFVLNPDLIRTANTLQCQLTFPLLENQVTRSINRHIRNIRCLVVEPDDIIAIIPAGIKFLNYILAAGLCKGNAFRCSIIR